MPDTLEYSSIKPRHRWRRRATRFASLLVGALLGGAVGFGIWFWLVGLVVPQGPDFTGYVEGMAMLLFAPIIIALGAGIGAVAAYAAGRRMENRAALGSRIALSDTGITCTRPDGSTDSISWEDLREVHMHTGVGDGGDLDWMLIGNGTTCVISDETPGVDRLLARLTRLPGFDDDAVVRATQAVSEDWFLRWRKPSPATDRPPASHVPTRH